MTGLATLTSKNQLTLPSELISYLRLKAGDKFYVEVQKNKVILEEALSLEEIRGKFLKDPRVIKINSKYSTVEIVKIARKMKPSKNVYEY